MTDFSTWSRENLEAFAREAADSNKALLLQWRHELTGHATLMRFYSVSTTDDLIRAQALHIERLQSKVPPLVEVPHQPARFA